MLRLSRDRVRVRIDPSHQIRPIIEVDFGHAIVGGVCDVADHDDIAIDRFVATFGEVGFDCSTFIQVGQSEVAGKTSFRVGAFTGIDPGFERIRRCGQWPDGGASLRLLFGCQHIEFRIFGKRVTHLVLGVIDHTPIAVTSRPISS